ncbi:MAG: hypothetical protein ACKV22_38755 [Bryobacteraceae bacterium]
MPVNRSPGRVAPVRRALFNRTVTGVPAGTVIRSGWDLCPDTATLALTSPFAASTLGSAWRPQPEVMASALAASTSARNLSGSGDGRLLLRRLSSGSPPGLRALFLEYLKSISLAFHL